MRIKKYCMYLVYVVTEIFLIYPLLFVLIGVSCLTQASFPVSEAQYLLLSIKITSRKILSLLPCIYAVK